MVLLVSLVFSATRYDDWHLILRDAWSRVKYIVYFMGAVFLVLLFFSTILPQFQ
jgi:hypothetical protein